MADPTVVVQQREGDGANRQDENLAEKAKDLSQNGPDDTRDHPGKNGSRESENDGQDSTDNDRKQEDQYCTPEISFHEGPASRHGRSPSGVLDDDHLGHQEHPEEHYDESNARDDTTQGDANRSNHAGQSDQDASNTSHADPGETRQEVCPDKGKPSTENRCVGPPHRGRPAEVSLGDRPGHGPHADEVQPNGNQAESHQDRDGTWSDQSPWVAPGHGTERQHDEKNNKKRYADDSQIVEEMATIQADRPIEDVPGGHGLKVEDGLRQLGSSFANDVARGCDPSQDRAGCQLQPVPPVQASAGGFSEALGGMVLGGRQNSGMGKSSPRSLTIAFFSSVKPISSSVR